MVFNNGPHAHILIDLPTRYSIEEVNKRIGLTTVESLKGGLPGFLTTEPYGLEWRSEETIEMVPPNVTRH
jgi:hypothetical protein